MISVIKANGEKEPFSEKKVIHSIQRAHIPKHIQDEALAHIKQKLYDGISTEEIYRHILEFLDRSEEPYSRARYSLKESVMMLGPTGYPFEDYVARLFESEGYHTQVRQILNGKCITHEIDVVAKKENIHAMIEAKFHNHVGTRSEVQTALYTQARFQDIKEKNKLTEAWLVTNTKTTEDANAYAACMGMKVMSWNYPEGKGLRELIEKAKLFPITMLSSLSQSQKTKLLQDHHVLCQTIVENPKVLDPLPLSQEEREKTLSEAQFICK